MPESRSLSLAEDRAYDLIERAMMESARGRQFLAEFVRRHRSADTTKLLDAMGRLEQVVAREHVPTKAEDGGDTLVEWAGEPDHPCAAQTSPSIAGRPSKPAEGPEVDPEGLAPAVRQATGNLLGEAETLQDAAWRLRESGAAAQLCAELDQCATRIYAACSSQEALAQRMENAVKGFRQRPALSSALQTRNDRASEPAASWRDGPEDHHAASDADRLRDLARRLRHAAIGLDANAMLSLDDLDRLSIEERLTLFS